MKNPLRLLALFPLLTAIGCSRKPVAESEAACVDRLLAERHLDPYGAPEGTMYAGGNPLFDERTGKQTDRLTYVYAHAPEVRQACAKGAQ